jgi:multidrug efflux pump subunit AcrA (membrane-fusion protein)
MMNIYKPLMRIMLFTGITLLPLSCRNSSVNEEGPEITVTPVTLTPVSYKSMKSAVDLPAISGFLQKSTVRSTVAGTLQKISVVQGQSVEAKQLLFLVKTRESTALGNSNSNDSTLNFNGSIEIKSNSRGVVSSVKYQEGDFVQEGDELAVIAEKNSLVFFLEVPVEYEKYISRNKRCMIGLPDSRIIEGTITGRLPEMNLEAQTVRYIIKPSVNDNFPENLIANVSIITAEKDKATVLPKDAVLSNETQTEFWVMKLINDSVAVKTIVQKGLENDEEVEIREPQLLQSDRIILTGNYGLPDTAKISVMR